MPIEQNKAIAQRFVEQVWNQGRLEVADEFARSRPHHA